MIIVATFAGVGKTTFARLYPSVVTDFVCMPFKYYLPEQEGEVDEACKASLDNEMRPDWPYNYVSAIKEMMEFGAAGEILLIPSDARVLRLLREENIHYTLCYPAREAKEAYRQRYIERGNTEEFLSVFIGGWDRFMDSLEADPSLYRRVMEPHQYLSDVITLLYVGIREDAEGTAIIIRDELAASTDSPADDSEEPAFTLSIGPATPEPVALGTKLSEIPKWYNDGPEAPEDENYVVTASFRPAYLLTNNDALATLRRLGLLDKYLRIPDWATRSAEEVTAYLAGHEDGICVEGEVITFGGEAVDRESMELLCMLDLLDKPIGGWYTEGETGEGK
jgi:hypothetical protein